MADADDMPEGEGWSRRRKIVVALAVVVVLAVWPWQPPATTPSPTSGFRLLWARPFGSVMGQTEAYQLIRVKDRLVVLSRGLFTGCQGWLFDPVNGEALAPVTLANERYERPLARTVWDGALVTIGDGREARLHNPTDLSVIWERHLIGRNVHGDVLGQELFLLNYDYEPREAAVWKLRRKDGAATKVGIIPMPAASYGVQGQILALQNRVLIAIDARPLLVMDAKGKVTEVGHRPLQDPRLEDLDKRVVVVADTDGLDCYSTADLSLRWSIKPENITAPPHPLGGRRRRTILIKGDGMVLTHDLRTEELLAIDLRDGRVRWRKAMPELPVDYGGGPVDGGFVILCCDDPSGEAGQLCWVDAATSTILGTQVVDHVDSHGYLRIESDKNHAWYADQRRLLCWELVRPLATPPAP